MKARAKLRTVTVVAVLVATAAAGTATAEQEEPPPPAPEPFADATEEVSVVEVHLAGSDELDRLVGTGVDLDHNVDRTAEGIVAHAVVTPSEAAALEADGFRLGAVVFGPDDSMARVAEREATIAEHVAENEEFAAAAASEGTPVDVSDVRIIRADYFTSFGEQFLSVEAKWANGQTSDEDLTVERDSGRGTAFGSGGTDDIGRFVDAGVYLYHRGQDEVDVRPHRIRIVSPTGDVAIAKVRHWLPPEGGGNGGPYLKDFVTSYMTPTDVYDRIHQLAAEFPDLAEVVELPYRTNGYRRVAQALLDPPGNRLVVDPPSAAAGAYGFAGPAGGGPGLPASGLSGSFALVNDGSDAPTLGCGSLVGFPAGSIAVVDRGTCPFVDKTRNAQAAGAIAVVVVNNVPGAPISPATAAGITIPAIMVSLDNGALIKSSLPATGTLIPGVPISNAGRVGVDSKAWGHEGGNDITIATVNPGQADSPLTVTVTGNDITVGLATNSAGATVSTAAHVVNAINAHPAAAQLVSAYTYRGSSGTGVAPASPRRNLSDFLSAPGTVSRDPHPVYAIRIGTHRDGSRTGVLAYAQEHAREWVPPLVAVETAERLLRNYAHDLETKRVLDNLDIWIAPSINPDGGHYSFYDFSSQRKNMTRHCPVTDDFDLNGRNDWGVDNNRNYTEFSLFDGYFGASTDCTDDVFAGPSELSEPENKNLDWLASRPNMTFAMNLHSSGNFFMWSPGSYRVPGRISAPRPTLEEESFFWGASARILTAIKEHRGLSVTPARTGPISDVLYSAAGNSGDMLWYKYGIYAWNFEVGTQFQPPWEGDEIDDASAHQESQEFANGLVELMSVAYDYIRDHHLPRSRMEVSASSTPGMVTVTFDVSEPAAVFYTLDGSAPTYSSTLYASAGIREGGERLTIPEGTRVHWFSVDSAGNVERNYVPDGTGTNYNKATARR